MPLLGPDTDGRGVRSGPLAELTVKGLICSVWRDEEAGRAAPKVKVERFEYMSSEAVRKLALSLMVVEVVGGDGPVLLAD